MTWQEQMQQDAAGLAFPNLTLEPGDVVKITGDWNEGFYYSEYTNEAESFSFSVTVWREQGKLGLIAIDSRGYSNKEAAEFFAELMEWGTKE